jgi:hypothetical protein
MKKLFLIDYENAHWCGGQLNVCVWAESGDEAVLLAEDHMADEQRELYSDEYMEAEDDWMADECPYTVNRVEEFGPSHEEWKFYMDPTQRNEFYPTIGEE